MQSEHAEITAGGASLHRRNFLKLGAVSPLALWASELTGQEIVNVRQQTRDALPVLLIYLHGGASHKEIFCPDEPTAPSDYRGPFSSIPTSVPGIHFSELWKNCALHADRMALIKSIDAESHDHPAGAQNMLKMPGGEPVAIAWGKQGKSLPYVFINSPYTSNHTDAHKPDDGLVAEWYQRGTDYQSSKVLYPNLNGYYRSSMSAGNAEAGATVRRRQSLLNAIPGKPMDGRAPAAYQNHRETAYDILTGQGFGDAFYPESPCDLASETESKQQELRGKLEKYQRELERYGGRNSVAQSIYLGMRLIEQGVHFVTVNHSQSRMYGNEWDDHAGIGECVADRAPPLDKALGAALLDMREKKFRPMLIAIATEFNRTPKVNNTGGRDHWSLNNALVLAAPEGHAIQGGSVYGKTHYDGTTPDGYLKATDGVVPYTIIHAAANGQHNRFIPPNAKRPREIMLNA